MASRLFNEALSLFLELNVESLETRIAENLWKGAGSETDVELLRSLTVGTRKTLFREILDVLKEINEGGYSSTFWNFLGEKQFPYKNLILLLGDFIESQGEDKTSANRAIDCGIIYLILLSLSPNCFHPFLLRSALNLLKSWLLSHASTTSTKRTKKNSKKAKRKAAAIDSSPEEDSGDLDNEKNDVDDLEAENPFDEEAKTKKLVGVDEDRVIEMLKQLHRMLKVFSMERSLDSRTHLIEVLCELTRYNGEESKDSISKLAFTVLLDLLHHFHGPMDQTVLIVMKNMLPSLTMSSHMPSAATVPKESLAIQRSAIEFIKGIIEMKDEQLYEPIHAVLQHVCTKVVDKADYRVHTSEAIQSILLSLPQSQRPRFLKFLQRFSKNSKSNLRLFALEVCSSLLLNLSEGSEEFELLIEILVSRSSDKVASVRAKALTSLSVVFQESSSNPYLSNDIRRIISIFHSVIDVFLTDSEIKRMYGVNSAEMNENMYNLMNLLRRRISDEKCGVRKAAIQAAEMVSMTGDTLHLEAADLHMISDACFDAAISVRKQAMQTLTQLMRKFSHHTHLSNMWIQSILPLTMDPESSVQERCLDLIEEMLFQKLCNFNKNSSDTEGWIVLNSIDGSLIPYLQKACSLLGKQKRIKKQLTNALQSSLSHPQLSKGSLLLLSEVAPFVSSVIDVDIVLNYWNNIKHSEDLVQQQQILKVLECVSTQFSKEISNELKKELISHLCKFETQTPLIRSFVQLLVQLCKDETEKTNKKSRQEYSYDWAKKLLELCDEALAAIVLPKTSTFGGDTSNEAPQMSSKDPEVISRYLFTLGEVAQICPSAIPKRVITVAQALISPSMINAADEETVRAHAFITLGKLCLVDEHLSKKCIPAFAKELESSSSPIIRNNILIILCDLCVKYTAVVDKYIPNIALSIRDPSELVRKQALMLLARLLQEDFLKWKNTIFYKFVVALADDSLEIRQLAKFCFVTLLSSKNALMFFTHFVETLFVLNDHRLHHVYNQHPQSEKERKLFSLTGSENRNKRITIYKIFINNMNSEQKFQTTAKLCQDIIGSIVENTIPLSDSGELLSDALTILGCKEIKVNSRQQSAAEDEEEALAMAKEKILSKIVKKNVLENIVPIVIELKNLLEKQHSPLLRNLMEYLKELFKDYKDEIEDILVADKQLAKEIQFDIRQFMKRPHTPIQSPRAMTPRKSLNSPRPNINTPLKQEIANFSIPKIRNTPSSQKRLSAVSLPLKEMNVASPYKSPAASKITSVVEKAMSSQRADIILASPVNDVASKPQKWRVSVQSTLTFDEEDEQENSVPVEIISNSKRKNATASPVKSPAPVKNTRGRKKRK